MEEFRRLYETVYQDLYRLAYYYLGNAADAEDAVQDYYYLGNAADAEDAVQDTALAAWRGFGSLKKKEAFRAWILQILVNTCRRALRKKTAAGYGVLSPDPAAELDAQRADAQRAGASKENLTERLELLELLSGLDDEERLIVLLTVFGGYKGEEIAKILNRGHSTVRSRYRRALKKLERKLQEKEESL